jgi:hypothetical protein
MATSTKALVYAIITAIACPFLLFGEVVVFMLAAMIALEPSNTLLIKVVSVVVVILIGAIVVALPITAFVMGKRARNVTGSRDTPIAGASKALVAQVIAGVVFAGVVLVQMFLFLWAAGVCSLDGCG